MCNTFYITFYGSGESRRVSGFFVAATAAAAVCLAIAKNEFILIQGVVQAQPSLPIPFSGSGFGSGNCAAVSAHFDAHK